MSTVTQGADETWAGVIDWEKGWLEPLHLIPKGEMWPQVYPPSAGAHWLESLEKWEREHGLEPPTWDERMSGVTEDEVQEALE